MTALAIAVLCLSIFQIALLALVVRLRRRVNEAEDTALHAAIALGAHADHHRRAHVHQQARNRARTN